jgi:L-2-hydroxycarboxylate dehydrogenase (NAD+)
MKQVHMNEMRVEDIRRACLTALVRAGTPQQNAELQTDLLLQAELAGHVSHGLLRLPRLIARIKNGVADPRTNGTSSWQNGAFLKVDGQNGLGPVIAMTAIELISARARESGVAMAAISGANHLGMLAWYAEKIASAGQVALLLTTSEALVHPWGGRTAMIGTNPISIGVPAEPYSFVMDMATSSVSMGKIHDYANRGQEIPLGWALDREGSATTDATRAMHGAIAPFGGSKGYALGLAFEVIVASLTSSALGTDIVGTLDDHRMCNKGDVIIVIEPAQGAGAAVSAYLDAIRRTTPIDLDKAVLVPGDRAREHRVRRTSEGLKVAPEIWNQIEALAAGAIKEHN